MPDHRHHHEHGEHRESKPSTTDKKSDAKHTHWAVYLGAIIVLGTFVVKEALAEHWRNISETLDRAQSTYSIRIDTSGDEMRYEMLLKKLVEATKAMQIPSKKAEDANPSISHFNDLKNVNDGTGAEIEHLFPNIKSLADKLPEDDNWKRDLSAFAEQMEKAKQEVMFVDRLYIDDPPARVNRSPVWKNVKPQSSYRISDQQSLVLLTDNSWKLALIGDPPRNASERSLTLSFSLLNLRREADSLTKNILEEAEKVRTQNERWAKVALWITSILFLAGWGLELWGKLHGVEGFSRT